MNRLAVLVVLVAIAGPAIAQDASSASSVAPPPSSSATAPAASSSAPAAPAPTAAPGGFAFAQVMGTLADTSPETPVIAAVTKKSTVMFVEMHLLSGYQASALTFTAAQTDALTALHKTIGRNNAFMAKLRKAGYLLDDVVAVLAGPDGTPYVFIDL